MATTVLTLAANRFRAPMEPFVILLAALGVDRAVYRVRGAEAIPRAGGAIPRPGG